MRYTNDSPCASCGMPARDHADGSFWHQHCYGYNPVHCESLDDRHSGPVRCVGDDERGACELHALDVIRAANGASSLMSR